MKTLIKFGFLALLAAATASCTTEKQQNLPGTTTLVSLEAVMAEMPQTKAVLTDNSKIKWELGDQLLVFSDTDDPVSFENKTGEGNTFSSSTPLNGSEFYACFPAWAYIHPDDNKTVEFFLDTFTQVFTGKNPSVVSPMVAKSNGKSFQFRQTAGLLHFAITGTGELVSVSLSGNDGEPLTGNARLSFNDAIPVLQFPEEGCGRVASFTPDTPVKLSKEEVYDVYFVLPPMSFSKGFTIELNFGEETVSKSTSKAVTIQRAIITNYTLDADSLKEDEEDALTLERNALIAFYNAMNGPNWTNNTNWCSDRPVSEWCGVRVENEHVYWIQLPDNNCSGTIPESIANLTELKEFRISQSINGKIDGYENVFKITGLESIEMGNYTYWSDFEDAYMTEIPASIGNLKNLRSLTVFGLKGTLPAEFYQLDKLESVWINNARLEGGISSDIGNLSNLTTFHLIGLDGLPSGTLPAELFDCTKLQYLELVDTGLTGSLPSSIGNLHDFHTLNLCGNRLSGQLPKELAGLDFIGNAQKYGMIPTLQLYNNQFSGKVPAEFRGWDTWNIFWAYVIGNNNLDYSDARPQMLPFDVVTLDGSHYTRESLADNTLTVFFSWDSENCPASVEFSYTLDNLYKKYKSQGFDILGSSAWQSSSVIRDFVSQQGWQWPNFDWNWGNEEDTNMIGYDWCIFPWMSMPNIVVYNKDGDLVFDDVNTPRSEFTSFVEDWYGAGEYSSTDYSADGAVHVLQTATEGAGIDIVFMGDAYSDRLIADGTYANTMNAAMEAFFVEEPYKSFRNHFNVSYVDVVSKNEVYYGSTALGTWYGEGTEVCGDHAKVAEYTQKALAVTGGLYETSLTVVFMNRDYYAGTCYMTPDGTGDYGRGPSIAYMPVSADPDTFGSTLRHEAGGHGFAKLADEYSYPGTIPQTELDKYHSLEPLGWYRNVDFTADPSAVKWSLFIADERYASEGIGVFEGACTYAAGAYRPTEESIMNHNRGGFNAPSRFAIWYAINKIAYGESWTGGYDEFTAWDLAHRSAAPRKAAGAGVRKNLPPLAPPVVLNSLTSSSK